jgi:twitching motility protein PilT
MQVNFGEILKLLAQEETISDIHIAVKEPIIFRQNGDIVRQTQRPTLTNEDVTEILVFLLNHDQKRVAEFRNAKDMDFSYTVDNGPSYRVNAALSLGKLSIAMRKINSKAKNLEELMYQDIAQSVKDNILSKKSWLYLVNWPTGSGKSTSIVSMLQYLNQERHSHIITIEDPIEFMFTPDRSLITQREIGLDTDSFAAALRSAMREDPNIILIGEIRDKHTAEAAINMAETGHIVFSTLHTSSAAATVNRYIWFFEPEVQEIIADRLADALLWVQCQYLVKTSDGKNRVWVYEFMINNTAIRNNIKKRDLKQIDSTIETSANAGMISMKWYGKRLIDQGIVNKQDMEWLFWVDQK